MKLTIADLPEEIGALPEWLERQIIGAHLLDLITELDALRRVSGHDHAAQSLEQICAADMDAIYHRGLAVLRPQQLTALLQSPAALLQLQESVLLHGGEYWLRVTHETAAAEAASTGAWDMVAAACGLSDDPPTTESTSPVLHVPVASGANVADGAGESHESRRPGRRMLLAGMASLAAIFVVGIGLYLQPTPVPRWGFDGPGLLTAQLPPEKYLRKLADSAEQWFNQRPDDRAGVLRRLREFEHGCNTLIAAPHPQLAAVDRAWLVERCGVWKGKLIAQTTALEAGQITPAEARAATDEIVRTLQAALRTRATTLQA